MYAAYAPTLKLNVVRGDDKGEMRMKLLTCVLAMLVLAGCSDRDENEPGSEGTQAETMVELETDLPSIFKENPIPRRKPGEPFLVPQGTKLLSRGVEVTSSDEEPIIGKLEMITDGNEEDQDMGYDSYSVESGYGLQWVQLDLGKPHALYAILVWHYYLPRPSDYWNVVGQELDKLPRVYQDVVVQISNDPAFKKDVKTIFNNDHDNSSGLGKGKDDAYVETSEGRWINPKGVEGRYVRLYSDGYNLLLDGKPVSGGEDNHYIEVEVYGK